MASKRQSTKVTPLVVATSGVDEAERALRLAYVGEIREQEAELKLRCSQLESGRAAKKRDPNLLTWTRRDLASAEQEIRLIKQTIRGLLHVLTAIDARRRAEKRALHSW